MNGSLPPVGEGFEWRTAGDSAWLAFEGEQGGAVFTTRLGGVSSAPFDSMNLGLLTGDDPEHVAENRARAAGLAGLSADSIAAGHQVHGADLAEHDDALLADLTAKPGSLPQVDGHVVRTPDQAALVLVADCLPIVLWGRGGAAVLHGGWRGIAAGIIERAAPKIEAAEAAIGPGIGPCCFEIGQEVRDAFEDSAAFEQDGAHLDLAAAAEERARAVGIDSIHAAGICTRCNSELFFSHRGAGPRTGRQAGIGWFRG